MSYLQWWFEIVVQPSLDWLQSLGTELTSSLSDGAVWSAIGIGVVVGALALALGVCLGRWGRLIHGGSPVGETVGVGLGLGLLVLAVGWAAIGSGGRSAFLPAAIGCCVATGVSLVSLRRRGSARFWSPTSRAAILGWLGVAAFAAAFVVVIGLLYASTLAPSARDGVQPLEFLDEAYYSVLGANLVRTGTESIYSPSGFDAIAGAPAQSWYHWGELWLASAVIKVTGLPPMLARHLVVLPLILLATATLTGTVVRRLARTESRSSFLLGAAGGVLLAPMPLLLAGSFGWWVRGNLFSVTQYGIAVVIVLLALYVYATGAAKAGWVPSIWAGVIAASLIPAHIALAMVAVASIVAAWMMRSAIHLARTKQVPSIPVGWQRSIGVAAVVGAATIVWGVVTDHGVGASAPSVGLSPFGGYWLVSVLSTIAGAGVYFAIPIAGRLDWPSFRAERWLFTTVLVSILIGALAWGARFPDYNMFHFFFGPLVVIGSPVAIVAVWKLIAYLRGSLQAELATAVLAVFVFQTALGAIASVERLRQFSPIQGRHLPVELLQAIRSLPPTAKIAYSCDPLEDFAFWGAQLISIDAHTGRPVVPMCFQTDTLSRLNGAQVINEIENPLFRLAPQRALYPRFDARPSSSEIRAFMDQHGIAYIYADATHPNLLVPDAITIAESGDAQVLRVP